jgi:hypothetical protein
MESVEAGDIGTGHVLANVAEDATLSGSSAPPVSATSPSGKKKVLPQENPHKYVRQQVPPKERSLRKPALRNDTPSQAALFSKTQGIAESGTNS